MITVLRNNWIPTLSRALLNPRVIKVTAPLAVGSLRRQSAEFPRGESLFNYTRRRLPPLNSPIPTAGSSICGSACHLQFWDTDEGEKAALGSPGLRALQSSAVKQLFHLLTQTDVENKHINRCILESITASRHGDNQTLVRHHQEKKMKKKPFRTLNPTDDICLVLLLLLLRPTSVCPAAGLEIRQ